MPCNRATLHNVSRGLSSAIPLIGQKKTGIHLARSIYILSHSITVAMSNALGPISLLLIVRIHMKLESSGAWRAEVTSFSGTMAKRCLEIKHDRTTEPLGYLT